MEGQQDVVSVRRYMIFNKPNRIFHQNAGKLMDVKSFSFSGVQVLEYRDSACKTQQWKSGWAYITSNQVEAPEGSGQMLGSISVDIVVEDVPMDSMFSKGSIAVGKTISSVIGTSQNGSPGTTLITVVQEPNSLRITQMENCLPSAYETAVGNAAFGPSPALAEDRKRERQDKPSHDDDRGKKCVANGAFYPRDPRSAGKREKRRAEEESEYQML
ncbi:B112 [miniopterid betaherpesvirus 1]|uniref:B112 n=1 Tax=miniopterid betaherpesvirus 1 TaxID=3070189 RepID=I3VQA2_9BETA|nr:B112 [miniopterid betaherpesvirus 1]AFK83946.1 B112 [miniopterid betaherpesvirus 1]